MTDTSAGRTDRMARRMRRWAQQDAERRNLASLPKDEDRELGRDEAHTVRRAFLALCETLRGSAAAPTDLLPLRPSLVAQALSTELGTPDEDPQRLAELLVDLQCFVPEDLAAAANANPPDADAVERIALRQAGAIAWLRNDPTVIGNHVAFSGRRYRIGEGRAALEAVRMHRNRQASAFLAFGSAPIGAAIGGLVAWLVPGVPLLIALPVTVILGGASFFAAPFLGMGAGTLTTFIERFGRSLPRGRTALEILAGVVALVGPALGSLAVVVGVALILDAALPID